MKILLVSAPKLPGLKASRGTLPISLLHLAAALRAAGHTPDILDLSVVEVPNGLEPEIHYSSLTIKKIQELNPGYVGISCFSTMHFPLIRKLAQAIKQVEPLTPICLGGAHPTFYSQDILTHCNEIDFIVIGEGEIQSVELANAIEYKNLKAIRSIHSFVYRDEYKKIIKNKRTSFIENLDSLPIPAYDLVNMSDYYTDHSNWYNPKDLKIRQCVPVLTTRSCPFDCNFCSAHSIMGRKLRRRNPENVVNEIELLVREYGQNYFTFVDDNVNVNKHHFIAICDGIAKRKLNIQISVSQGMYLNSVDEEVIHSFVQAGGVTICAPIESGSDYIRNDIIGKKLSIDSIRNSIKLFKKYNLFTIGLFIMGFEEDTNLTLQQTLKLIYELKLDVNAVSTLIPFPGTRIHMQALKNKTLLFDDSQTWSGDTFFDPQNKQQFFIKPPNISFNDLINFRKIFDSLYFYSDRAIKLNKQQ